MAWFSRAPSPPSSTLSGLVEFDGYYLESDPCLVCNNPEVPFCVSGRCLVSLRAPFGLGLGLWAHWARAGWALRAPPLPALQYIKLSSIKVDTRYTTTQQVVKLIGSHTISKVTVKIGDLKRTKMVRTINLYYNNRTVQAIVELKNKYGALVGVGWGSWRASGPLQAPPDTPCGTADQQLRASSWSRLGWLTRALAWGGGLVSVGRSSLMRRCPRLGLRL